MQFLQCQRGPVSPQTSGPCSASHWPTETCSDHSEGNTGLGDFSVLCSLSLQPELVAGPWGRLTDVGFVPKLTSVPSLQCHLKNCLSPRSQSNLAMWGHLQSVRPGRWYPRAGDWKGRRTLAPPQVLTCPTSFFSRSRCGGSPPQGAQRPEKLSEPLNLTCITAGDASRPFQMQAKNTKEQGPSVMETLRACDMRQWLCGC